MRIIIEFDASHSPVIKLEQASQTSAQSGTQQPAAFSQSGTTDAGQAPGGAATDNAATFPSASAMLMSGSQQNAAMQSGAADGGQAFSAGSPAISFNNGNS